jgi:hypothetical protein
MTWDVFGRMAAEGEKLAASKASLTEKTFIELLTSGRKRKASKEGSK